MLFTGMASAHAGSPDGLQLLILGTTGADAQAEAVKQYFARYSIDKPGFNCLDSQLNISEAYQQPIKGVSAELALAALNDKKQRKQLSKLVKSYRDRTHDRGFDGVLLYDVSGDKLVFRGIPGDSGDAVLTSPIALTDVKNTAKFNLAICKAMVEIPVLMEP